MTIVTKRIHEPFSAGDGRRILVDRLWPRGISNESARIDAWVKEVAPSNELRRWYDHDPARWDEFRQRYFAELDANPEGVAALEAELQGRKLTFLFAAKETERNNATALREYLTQRTGPKPRAPRRASG